MRFQSTPSAWRETIRTQAPSLRRVISIHSLRMEGDRRFLAGRCDSVIFQSTPSAWRETGAFPPFFWMEKVFQSTPSAWRETLFPEVRKGQCSHFNPLPPHGGRHHFRRSHVLTLSFQSTPSAWRETRPPSRSIFSDPVFQSTPSAWRETIENSSSYTSVFHFNPLPPHGGRLTTWTATTRAQRHFNPLPPHGGRPSV